jgi:hypothetical protein
LLMLRNPYQSNSTFSSFTRDCRALAAVGGEPEAIPRHSPQCFHVGF